MKSIQEMVYNFKLKVDRLDSKANANIQFPAIIQFLNEGQLSLCKKRYGGLNSNYKAAFEEIQKRRDEFQRLLVPDEVLSAKKINKFTYTSDLTDTKEEYMFLLRAIFTASKGRCDERIMKGVLIQTDDMNVIVDSPLDASSFEWGECNYRLAQNKVRSISDGTFEIKAASIDYLRYPTEMDIEGYKHFDGSTSKNVDSELPRFLLPDIVDEAWLIYTLSNPQAEPQKVQVKMVNNE